MDDYRLLTRGLWTNAWLTITEQKQQSDGVRVFRSAPSAGEY
jgi:hypothetical protein